MERRSKSLPQGASQGVRSLPPVSVSLCVFIVCLELGLALLPALYPTGGTLRGRVKPYFYLFNKDLHSIYHVQDTLLTL